MKTLIQNLSVVFLLSTLATFDARATLHRIPFPEVTSPDQANALPSTMVADSKYIETEPGQAIKTQSDDDESATAKKSSDFTVRLVRAKSRSSFKTVFKVEALDYTIQVSSFKTNEEAKAKIAELQESKLADLWIMNAKINGQNWFRVCYGHYKSKADAASAQAAVAEKSGSKQAFVQKVVPRLTASNSNAS